MTTTAEAPVNGATANGAAPAAPEQRSVIQALSSVMHDVGAVGKNQRNREQNYSFRGIDDVLNACHGPMSRHGVVIVPQVLDRITETRTTRKGDPMNVVHLLMRYRFYGPAGDHVDAEIWGEGTDTADKATNKAASAALKYALFQTLAIPTDEMDDGDRDTVEAAPEGGGRRADRSRSTPDDDEFYTAPPTTSPQAQAFADEAQQAPTRDVLLDVWGRAKDAEQLDEQVQVGTSTGLLRNYLSYLGQQLAQQDPPAQDPPAGGATEKQLQQVAIRFGECGVHDKTVRNRYVTAIVDRPVASMKELTHEEAETLLAEIKQINTEAAIEVLDSYVDAYERINPEGSNQ